jgi:hypothetical protein
MPRHSPQSVEVPRWVAILVPFLATLLGGAIAIAGSYFVATYQADQAAQDRIQARRLEAYTAATSASAKMLSDFESNARTLQPIVHADESANEILEINDGFRAGQDTQTSANDVISELATDVTTLEVAVADVRLVGTKRAKDAAQRVRYEAYQLVSYCREVQKAWGWLLEQQPGSVALLASMSDRLSSSVVALSKRHVDFMAIARREMPQ